MGCAFILPAAVFGTVILIEDHLHSGGWLLVAELVGWWVICLAASAGCTVLMARWRADRRGRAGVFLASAAAGVFTMMAVGVAQPGAPDWLKDASVALMQVIGIATGPVIALLVGLTYRKSQRS